MRHVVVTGAAGFIGRNVRQRLARRGDVDVRAFDAANSPAELPAMLHGADVVLHLAGVNRPERIEEFQEVNAGLTAELIGCLREMSSPPGVIFASSTQAADDNPYGRSKRDAEEALAAYAATSGAAVRIYRLPGVFGKWCRPNYNSVVATFCHNVARGLPIAISDPARAVALVHVEDVVEAFCRDIDDPISGLSNGEVEPVFTVTLERLAAMIASFRDSRISLLSPDMADPLVRRLYSTYISYLPQDGFAYALEQRTDPRGSLAELLKSPHFGQVFVSRTHPGVTRGNHYHDVKVEKFCVLEGDAIIRFRAVDGDEVLEYPVSGHQFRVVDIPPGYTHSIENVGGTELIVLFWACEIFDPDRPDTHAMNVRP